MFRLLVIIAIQILFVNDLSMALKILFVQPRYAYFRSHFGFGLSLAELLAQDGHQVLILAPIREENDKLIESPLADNSYLEIIGDMELMNKLKAEKYDVGIAEAFMLTEYSLAIFYFLEIPKTIATHSQPMSPVQLYLLNVMSRMKSGNFLASVGQPTLLITNDEERRKIIGTQIGDHRANQLKERGPEIWKHCVDQKDEKLRQHKTQDTLYQKLADEKYGGKIFPVENDLVNTLNALR
uniref:Glucuronosyltransferase n=1 Tax=Globodera pallida TaxID=36090 RepID=A0A183BYE2_GLOPA